MLRNRAWLRRAVDALNLCMFAGEDVHVRVIGWERWRPSSDRYGFAFVEDKEIWLNRALAWPSIPDYVVVHTVYHEMLHIRLGHDHDERFALAERRFVHFPESQVWNERHFETHVRNGQRPDWRLLR